MQYNLVLFAALLVLSGCGTTPSKPASPAANNWATPEAVEQKIRQFNQQPETWRQQVEVFHQADFNRVKSPYVALVHSLDNWPDSDYCSQQQVTTIWAALSINPTSLMAHSLMMLCADQNEDPGLYNLSAEAFLAIADVLMDKGDGESPKTALGSREIYESHTLLSWAGYEPFDTELVATQTQVLFRLHSMDTQTRQYAVHYADNFDYYRQSIRHLTNGPITDEQLVELYIKSLQQLQEPAVELLYLSHLLIDGRYQNVIQRLSSVPQPSPIQTLRLGMALLNTDEVEPLDALLDEVLEWSQNGVVDASALVGQILLSTLDEDDAQEAVSIFEADARRLGAEEAMRGWFDSFLYLPLSSSPSQEKSSHARFYARLPSMYQDDWYQYVHSRSRTRFNASQQFFEKVKGLHRDLLVGGNPQAHFDWAMMLINGELNQPIDEQQGISALLKAAHLGSDDAQLKYGYFLSTGKHGVTKDLAQANQWYHKAAEQGNSAALYNLALAYKNGTGVAEDAAKALEYYHLAAQAGDADAATNLGYYYEAGEGVEVDMQLSVQYYQQGAAGDSARAHNNLATLYRDGTGVEQDHQKALTLYQQALALGSAYAANNLGDMYYYGEGVDIDYSSACDYYQIAVDRDFDSSVYDLSYCFLHGEGREKDQIKGLSLLRQAADLGDVNALNDLARLYSDGELVEQDLDQAIRLFQRANTTANVTSSMELAGIYASLHDYQAALQHYQTAHQMGDSDATLALSKLALRGQVLTPERGRSLLQEYCHRHNLDADLELAHWHYFGELGEKNFEQARTLYQLVADKNSEHSKDAFNNLGQIYANGYGVQIDHDQAIYLYQEGYKRQSSHAAFNLARLYRSGIGVLQDPVLALLYFEKSAEWGYSPSMYETGNAYFLGVGTRKDMTKATYWLELAVEQGSEQAKTLLKQINAAGS